MEPEQNHYTTSSPVLDIHSPVEKTHHHSRKIVMTISILVVTLGAIAIVLYLKQRHDYNMYLKTPEGKLQLLDQYSNPVTMTEEEQRQQLSDLRASSRPVKSSREERLKELEILEQ